MSPLRWKVSLQRLRVPFGFVFFAVFFIFSHPTWRTLSAGSAVAAAGLFIRGWASGHLRKNQELALSGPYAYTRNPLYFGSLILVAGFAICSANWWLAMASVALFFSIYWPVMLREEEEISRIFGDAVRECAAHVPRFFPRLRPYRTPRGAARFDCSLYVRYREYRAALGFAGVVAALAAKIAWL